MKKEDVKIRMKVVPFQNTFLKDQKFENLSVWRDAIYKGQKYLYVMALDKNYNAFILNHIQKLGGDYFNPEDFEPYEEVSESKMTLLDILEEEYLEKSLLTINKLIDSNFEKNSTLEDIFKAIAEKWDSL